VAGTTPTKAPRSTDIEAIKAAALQQVADGGPRSLSLNAIARGLGLTGPALYRYVAGRDDLIRLLLEDAFADFTESLRAAAPSSARPTTALRATAAGYRRWACDNSVRYQLMMGGAIPGFDPGPSVSERAMAAFGVLVDLVAAIVPGDARTHQHVAVRGWARLHGFVTLELVGHLDLLVEDPDRLFRQEIDGFVKELSATGQT
jgi:AcrR family transcriptional regulator